MLSRIPIVVNGVLTAAIFIAFPVSARGQALDLPGIVGSFYPAFLESFAADTGRPLVREQCFEVLQTDSGGAPWVIVAGYTNLSSAAVRVLVASDGSFRMAAEAGGEDLAGWGCSVRKVDIDRDGRPEAHVKFTANNASTDWLYGWDGSTLERLTPVTSDPITGLAQSDLVNANVVDVDGDGHLEIYSFDLIVNDEPPEPGRIYRRSGGSFVLDRQAVGVFPFARSTGAPETEARFIILPLGAQAPFTLRVYNGTANGTRVENAVNSGRIWLNGQEIVRPSDFGQNVPVIERTIVLPQDQNKLEVRLAGTPGDTITVVIDAGGWTAP